MTTMTSSFERTGAPQPCTFGDGKFRILHIAQLFIAFANSRKGEITCCDCRRSRLGFESTLATYKHIHAHTAHKQLQPVSESANMHIQLFVVFIYLFTCIVDDDDDDEGGGGGDRRIQSNCNEWKLLLLPLCSSQYDFQFSFHFLAAIYSRMDLAVHITSCVWMRAFQRKQFQFVWKL